jgi:hypothetical protein
MESLRVDGDVWASPRVPQLQSAKWHVGNDNDKVIGWAKISGRTRSSAGRKNDEHSMTIKAALPRRPQNAREHVLGDGAARGAIAAATHLTSDNCPAHRVFSPVVRGIEVEAKEKCEQCRPLAIEVLDEPPNGLCMANSKFLSISWVFAML